MEQIGRFKPGENIPVFATNLIVAGRFVKIVGDKTAQGDYSAGHCGAGEYACGVSQRDSAPVSDPATSQERRVEVMRRGGIARVLAGADITAGEALKSDAVGRAVPVGADVAAAAAELTVGAGNSRVHLTANDAGASGNDLTFQIVDPPGNNIALSVDVDGDHIIVTAATDGASAITSTADDVIAAINEHDTASQLVTADETPGNGTGVVVAVGPTHLAGGSDAVSHGIINGYAMADADVDAGEYVEVDLI